MRENIEGEKEEETVGEDWENLQKTKELSSRRRTRRERKEESNRERNRENTRVPLGQTRASNLDVPIADTTARLQPMRSRDLSRIGGA